MSRFVRVKENRDFRRAYTRGKALVTPYAVIYVNRNRTENIRLGITAGKKIGKAVKRNRAKRVVRAAFSECLGGLSAGYDFIIVARTRILSIKSTVLSSVLKNALENAGLYERERKNG